jgi:hypothetical protein
MKHCINSNVEISHLRQRLEQAGDAEKHKHGPEASSALGFCRELVPSFTITVYRKVSFVRCLGTPRSRNPACMRELVSMLLDTVLMIIAYALRHSNCHGRQHP